MKTPGIVYTMPESFGFAGISILGQMQIIRSPDIWDTIMKTTKCDVIYSEKSDAVLAACTAHGIEFRSISKGDHRYRRVRIYVRAEFRRERSSMEPPGTSSASALSTAKPKYIDTVWRRQLVRRTGK